MVDIKEVVLGGWEEYNKSHSTEIKLIDLFLVYAVLSALIQFIYAFVFGSYPFNSFISGIVSSIGLFIFTVCLRLQIIEPATFGNISKKRAYIDFVICNLILNFIIITFMG